MKINTEHLYHGAALNQIAEHPQFTAINVCRWGDGNSRSAFKINHDIGLYVKYASAPRGAFKEYIFNFTTDHIEELRHLKMACSKVDKVFIGLVCVKDKEICCLKYSQFLDLIDRRKQARKEEEEQYAILVTLKKNGAFRVYVNRPGEKGKFIGTIIKIPRNDFPNALFDNE